MCVVLTKVDISHQRIIEKFVARSLSSDKSFRLVLVCTVFERFEKVVLVIMAGVDKISNDVIM